MYNLCKIMIENGRTEGLKDMMGTFVLVGLLTKEEIVQLVDMMEGEK